MLKETIFALCTSVITFAACVTTPETGRRQLIIVPEGQMSQLGEQAYEEILTKEKKSSDKKLTAEVLEIGQRIAKASGKDYDWAFNLFESKDVNAFCLPGGKVGVYTGILPVAKTNAGLAAVIGHEVAHATAKHGAERLSQGLVIQSALALTDLALSNEKARPLIVGALGLGAQFGVMLPYSRKHESEADEIGLKYMAKAGYDPQEAVALWQRMGALGGNPPEFMSTHPNPDTRAKALQKQVAQVMKYYEGSKKIPTTAL